MIAWAKLEALAQGAALASRELWPLTSVVRNDPRRITVTPYILHDLIGIEPEQAAPKAAHRRAKRTAACPHGCAGQARA
jgi:hypothetical protein